MQDSGCMDAMQDQILLSGYLVEIAHDDEN